MIVRKSLTFETLHVVEPEAGIPLQWPADGVEVKVTLPVHHGESVPVVRGQMSETAAAVS